MQNMRMSAVFNTIGAIVAIILLPILSGCIETNVTLTCPPGQSEPPGPGASCLNNKTKVDPNTPVAANTIPVNPTGGTVPIGAKCSSAIPSPGQSFQCNAGVVGASCTIPAGAKKCRDTYNMGTTLCDCACMSGQ